jgi:hypothetical protein
MPPPPACPAPKNPNPPRRVVDAADVADRGRAAVGRRQGAHHRDAVVKVCRPSRRRRAVLPPARPAAEHAVRHVAFKGGAVRVQLALRAADALGEAALRRVEEAADGGRGVGARALADGVEQGVGLGGAVGGGRGGEGRGGWLFDGERRNHMGLAKASCAAGVQGGAVETAWRVACPKFALGLA